MLAKRPSWRASLALAGFLATGLPHARADDQGPDLSALIRDFQPDGIPGNASAALEAFGAHDDNPWFRGRSVAPEVVAQLDSGLDSPDQQMRLCCAAARTCVNPPPDSERLLGILIDQFGTDDVRDNANVAWLAFRRTPRPLPPVIVARLMAELNSPDPQRRHYAAAALATDTNVPLPQDLLLALVDQLGRDEIRGSAVRAMNTLLRSKETLPPGVIRALEAQLENRDNQAQYYAARVLDQLPGYTPPDSFYRALVNNFRGDDLVFNARRCMWILRGRSHPLPRAAVEAGEQALRSDDFMQRIYAGMFLAELCDRGECEATPLLVQTLLESLWTTDWWRRLQEAGLTEYGDDLYLYRSRGTAFRFFSKPGCTEATEVFERALNSDDFWRSLLAAQILALSGRTAQMDKVTEILLLNLADDGVLHNASSACEALSHLSPEAIPYLSPFAFYPDDPQLQFGVRSALQNIAHPPAPGGQLRFATHIAMWTDYGESPDPVPRQTP